MLSFAGTLELLARKDGFRPRGIGIIRLLLSSTGIVDDTLHFSYIEHGVVGERDSTGPYGCLLFMACLPVMILESSRTPPPPSTIRRPSLLCHQPACAARAQVHGDTLFAGVQLQRPVLTAAFACCRRYGPVVDPPLCSGRSWVIFGHVVDCLFFVDMLVSFDTAYWNDGNIVTSRSVNENKINIYNAVGGFRVVVFSWVMNAPFYDECTIIPVKRGRVRTEYLRFSPGDTARVFTLWPA